MCDVFCIFVDYVDPTAILYMTTNDCIANTKSRKSSNKTAWLNFDFKKFFLRKILYFCVSKELLYVTL